MKKMLMIVVLALGGMLLAQEKTMTLADARGKIDAVIKNPATMTAVMKQLSASDQTKFLADVNAAIEKMPGSANEQAAKFLEVNTAALKGAQSGNLTALVAEVYATVPPNSLTVINERFAADIFNRAADPSKTYTDAQFTAISKSVLERVQERTASADSSGVRNTFAILMLIRASNGSPADLRDTLVESLHDQTTRELAQNEWISPALGIDQEQSYDPLLGAASDEAELPDVNMSLAIAYVDDIAALTGDIASEANISDTASSLTGLLSPTYDGMLGGAGGTASLTPSAGNGSSTSTIPRSLDPSDPFSPLHPRDY